MTVDAAVNPQPVADFCRVIARHLSALADDLEQVAEPAGAITRGELEAVIERAFTDAGAIYVPSGPAADILADAGRRTYQRRERHPCRRRPHPATMRSEPEIAHYYYCWFCYLLIEAVCPDLGARPPDRFQLRPRVCRSD